MLAEDAKKVIERAGAKYIGAQKTLDGKLLHCFNDPATETTLALYEPTVSAVRFLMDESRASFGVRV